MKALTWFNGIKGERVMDMFEQIREHEQVVFCNDESTGLKAIIAIHSTRLGPALGGCRDRKSVV